MPSIMSENEIHPPVLSTFKLIETSIVYKNINVEIEKS